MRMKKFLLSVMLTMFSNMAAWSADGDTFTANTVEGIEMTFKVISETNKTCQVGVGLSFSVIPAISTETTGTITVPSSINGYVVTALAANAFYGCSGITTINIPNSITAIGSQALEGTGWYNNQPDGVVYLANMLYKWKGVMSSSTSVEILEGTIGIGERAFSGYSKLSSITIPQSVINIGDFAFNECSGLNAISIPEGVVSIGQETFYNCSGLRKIVFPESMKEIGIGAFSNCRNLASVTFLGNIMSVGRNAFKNTAWLNSQHGLVYIGTIAYKYCGSMPAGTNIDIENGTIEIAEQCFEQCTSLSAITLPTSLKTIGYRAFFNCNNLTSLDIPNSVNNIGAAAFNRCSGLTSINIPLNVTTIESSVFYNCTSLKSIIIPGSVTRINDSAFYGCSSLSSLVIPNSVIDIGLSAFEGCSSVVS